MDRVVRGDEHVFLGVGDDVDVDRHAVAQKRQAALERDRRQDLARGVRRILGLLRDRRDRYDVTGQLRAVEILAADDCAFADAQVRDVLFVDLGAHDEIVVGGKREECLAGHDAVTGLQRA